MDKKKGRKSEAKKKDDKKKGDKKSEDDLDVESDGEEVSVEGSD